MSDLFNNHSDSSAVYKHISLPIYKTNEFTFFRCVNVENWVYGRTISELHSGNLKLYRKGRYSRLFPNEKISYWANSKATALSEIKKHGGNKDYLTFIAYDDASSTFPFLDSGDDLTIVDGREFKFHEILLKIEHKQRLTENENKIVELIKKERPDCLAYQSEAKKDGLNFLFFESGFKKLALREVQLYFGETRSKNSKKVACAVTCDYAPILESYGAYFEPIVKVRIDSEYKNTEEYKLRCMNYKKSLIKVRNGMR